MKRNADYIGCSLARHIGGRVLFRGPTTTVQDGNGRDRFNQRDGIDYSGLLGAVRLWPTRAQGLQARGPNSKTKRTPRTRENHADSDEIMRNGSRGACDGGLNYRQQQSSGRTPRTAGLCGGTGIWQQLKESARHRGSAQWARGMVGR
jgi:hypothetical protein